MTKKQITDGIRIHRDLIVVVGLALNLGAVLVTSGVLYGRVDAVLDRAVADIAEVRREIKEEQKTRVEEDRRLEDLIRGGATARVAAQPQRGG